MHFIDSKAYGGEVIADSVVICNLKIQYTQK